MSTLTAVDASIVEEAADLIERMLDNGTLLPSECRQPIIDELRGIAAQIEAQA